MKTKLISLLLVVLMLAAVPFTAVADHGKEAVNADPDLSFSTETLYGDPIDSSIAQNYDLVMVNFWAEWCGPCVSELPALEQLFEEYDNLLIIGVWMGDSIDGAKAKLENAGVTYPCIKTVGSLQSYASGIEGIPTTYFFDKDGMQVGDEYVGSRSYDNWKSIITGFLCVSPQPHDDLSFDTETLYGDPIDSSITRNYDLTVVNFWAEWCGPCVGELPSLEQINQEYSNVLIIGVWIGDSEDSAKATLENAGVTYPCIGVAGSLWSYISEIEGIPTTYFFDKDGKNVGNAQVGSLSYSGWKYVIDDLLATVEPVGPVKPKITTQPKDKSVAVGGKVKFTVKAEGDDLTYQWYFRTSKTAKWKKVSYKTGKKATLSFTAKEAHDGYQYRCAVKNGDDLKSYSKTVTLHTGYAPEIETQPTTRKVRIGAKTRFKVVAEGEDLTYQWYYRTSKTAKWKKVSGDYAKKAYLTVKMSAKKNGYQYRCLVSNPYGKVYTRAATLKKK